jgi:hypothetical protein
MMPILWLYLAFVLFLSSNQVLRPFMLESMFIVSKKLFLPIRSELSDIRVGLGLRLT